MLVILCFFFFLFLSRRFVLFLPARPIFSSFPKDEIVGVGSNVSFSCAARGAPQPSIFWTREGSQELMFPGNEYQGRYRITEDGSLHVKSVLGKDEGHYVCSAISQAGASTATVFLQVLVLPFSIFPFSIFLAMTQTTSACEGSNERKRSWKIAKDCQFSSFYLSIRLHRSRRFRHLSSKLEQPIKHCLRIATFQCRAVHSGDLLQKSGGTRTTSLCESVVATIGSRSPITALFL